MWCWWRRWRPGRKLRCVIQLILSIHHSLLPLLSILLPFVSHYISSYAPSRPLSFSSDPSSTQSHRLNVWISLVFSSTMFLQEKERLKREKRDEKRLNKERKLELRRLELEMAKELNKPNEDMCLSDLKVNFTSKFKDWECNLCIISVLEMSLEMITCTF